MIELPRTLARWRPQLEILAADLAAPLGVLIERIALAFGSFPVSSQAYAGEVDGFAGLSRRGSYERLLASEWALAEAAPDEFLRRAASGELSFLELARREPAAARSCVALLDTGPDMLGSPRIVQLAVLIVLAQRASAANASFAWQCIHSQPGPMHAGFTHASVVSLLEGRSALRVEAHALDAWIDHLGRGPRLDELWVVGARACTSLAPTASVSRVVISDVLEPGARRVAMEVTPARRQTCEIALELPEPPACVRLLRDPFVTAHRAVTHTRARPTGALVFSGCERFLYARDAQGGVIQYAIPNSPRAKTARTRRYRTASGAPVVAVGRRGGAIFLSVGDGVVRAESPSGKVFGGKVLEAVVRPGDVDASPGVLRVLAIEHGAPRSESFWWIGGDGALMQFRRGEPCTVKSMALQARWLSAGVTSEPPGSWCMGPSARGWEVTWPTRFFGPEPGLPDSAKLPGDLGPVHVSVNRGAPAIAFLDRRDFLWTVIAHGRVQRLSPPGTVIGVVPTSSDAGLLILDHGERTLSAIGRAWTRTLARSVESITHVTLSPTSRLLAYTTASGSLIVLRLPWPPTDTTVEVVPLARFDCEGAREP